MILTKYPNLFMEIIMFATKIVKIASAKVQASLFPLDRHNKYKKSAQPQMKGKFKKKKKKRNGEQCISS